MSIFYHFPFVFKRPRVRDVILMAALMPFPAFAADLNLQVFDNQGGEIRALPGKINCTSECWVQVSSQALVSLFAVPNQGYRFKNWEGACAKTLGPLCTLKSESNNAVTARFVKAKVPQTPTRALLLLHDDGMKPTVWNDFVGQRFNDRCPVIYGGVFLEEEAVASKNKVHCYRISFGYYDMLKPASVTQDTQASIIKKKIRRRHLAQEVQAAVLGILDRHPNLSLTLVGQGQGSLAARTFLKSGSDLAKPIVGLLDLQTNTLTDAEKQSADLFQPMLSLKAEPDQNMKISAALAQLTQSRWMAR